MKVHLNCPACGKRMRMESYEIEGWHMWPECACGLRGPLCSAATHRGAAIKAGRAMRAIMGRIEERIRAAYVSGEQFGRFYRNFKGGAL